MAVKYISSWWIFILVAILDTVGQSSVEGLRALNRNRYLPKAKGTVKTIENLDDGDIIDCVDIYKQPAFNNPLIKELQMKPSSYPIASNKTKDPRPKFFQTWNKYGECPKGTVPIRRSLNNNGTISRKYPDDDPRDHEYATVFQNMSKGRGGKGLFNVWNPRNGGLHELSLSQLWVVSGHGSELNVAEAGWTVHPSRFHESRTTRFFISWTNDNYEHGCYNLDCLNQTGFVQTSERFVIGGELERISVIDGEQSVLSISLSRENNTGNWWLEVNDDTVGYFPRSIFTTLGDGADRISFGGEIVNHKRAGRHTTTEMGSGRFSHEGLKKASFISNIKVVHEDFVWVEPQLQIEDVTRRTCYDLTFGRRGVLVGTHFFFGGPGGLSPHCN